MTQWIPFELHTHTPHSDGRHTLLEMCQTAARLGLQGIALTDHNTVSGLIDAEAVSKETGIAIIPGMEWTTFYGHMLTLGAPYCEWRDLGQGDIAKGIARVHEQGGIVGIAHPYSMGSPICTGCHWEYTVEDWEQVDYMEVWHETMPPIKNHNAPALRQWTELLNQGYRISATSGRDWHHSGDHDALAAYTYVGLEDNESPGSSEAVVKAIGQGRLCLSMGPMLEVSLRVGGKSYRLGDEVPLHEANSDSPAHLSVTITRSSVPERPWGADEGCTLVINSNLGELARGSAAGRTEWTEDLSLKGLRWLRVELIGPIHGLLATLALTNPVYIEKPQL
ncbi:CehA/McbA family metallohydrolase [Paenibacillus sanguinis]|uniref:CehA/McbA family metallohydrolase n=1 Tax=Paenibacillus sanguinis TaxID=225906 RepID=UPI0003A186A3|nr:CehA/McbA family metallohydrolase [Paenibacillus sanguinis]